MGAGLRYLKLTAVAFDFAPLIPVRVRACMGVGGQQQDKFQGMSDQIVGMFRRLPVISVHGLVGLSACVGALVAVATRVGVLQQGFCALDMFTSS